MRIPAGILRDLQLLPKAHLHIHLEGAMRPQTLARYCLNYGIEVPMDTRGMQFQNFQAFNDVYRAASDSIRTKKDLARVILEVAEDAANDGALWIEAAFDTDRYSILRENSPYRLFETPREGWEFALMTAEEASKATGIGIAFISAIDRTKPIEHAMRRAQLTAKIVTTEQHRIQSGMTGFSGQYNGIVGLGLHGNEEGYPPEIFREAFQVGAKDAGILSIPHAGEIAPSPGEGAKSVSDAIELLGAARIQHGVLAAEDPALIDKLKIKNICLDICPSSNIQLSIFPTIKMHPLPELIKAGVACDIGSDDPLLFGPSLLDEYELCRAEFGFSDEIMATLARNSFFYSGAPPEIKETGLSKIDEWLESEK
ncbi:MAG: adenosine deaminase [Rhodospirillaceae bacterium]|nr:adenosine deaminase [Rhodospirillaceae bacterium]